MKDAKDEVPIWKKRYVGKPITLGAMVLWYPQGKKSVEPLVGVIVKLNNENVSLAIHDWENKDHVLVEGVYHIAEPKSQRPEMLQAGAWDYTDEWNERQVLSKRLAEIESATMELQTIPER